MTDELLPVEGISRRDLLKRSAIVGGASAMVWAAPSITTLGSRAFGASGTPPAEGWSFAAFVVRCGEANYRVKWNREGGFEQGQIRQCGHLAFHSTYTAALEGGATNATPSGTLFTVNPPGGDGETKLVFTIKNLSGNCSILNGESVGVAFQAGDCEPGGNVIDPLTIEFDLAAMFAS